MTADKPICSLSLDLDNQWSYMKTHGDPGWESYPSYLDLVVPRFLKILDDFGWEITVFIVGQDAALEKNREALQMITAAGHEIGNHSFNHEPWLHLYSKQQIEDEISRAERAIEHATGQLPRGFRGPGYSFSRATLEVLVDHDYLYDASAFPTFLGPLARAYYFTSSGFSKDERQKRKILFGSFRDGFRPIRPFSWHVEDRKILEIPVTTMPYFKLPFHFSYVLYMARFTPFLAKQYLRTAFALCRIARVQPSLLLHPLDFLSGEDVPALRFFPAMDFAREKKAETIYRLLGLLSAGYDPKSLSLFHSALSEQILPTEELPP